MRTLYLLCSGLLGSIALAQFPAELTQYLKLTDVQKTTIETLESGFQANWLDAQKRINALTAEINAETAQPVPDPAALGTRYVSIAAIQRSVTAGYAQLRVDSLAALTSDQRSSLAPLVDAGKQYPLVNAAVAANLLVSPAIANVLYLSFCCSSISPYSVPVELRDYLGLTQTQIDLFGRFSNAYSLLSQDIYFRQLTTAQALNDALVQEAPDSGVIGSLAAQLEDLTRKQTAAAGDLATQLQSLLTSDQKAKFAVISNANAQRTFINQAGCVNLIDRVALAGSGISVGSILGQFLIPAAQLTGDFAYGSAVPATPVYGCGYFK